VLIEEGERGIGIMSTHLPDASADAHWSYDAAINIGLEAVANGTFRNGRECMLHVYCVKRTLLMRSSMLSPYPYPLTSTACVESIIHRAA
jgi:hypothetical protein